MQNKNPDQLLIRGLGLRQLTANIFNYTVGSGIFVLPAVVAASLGSASLFAYLLCAFIMAMVVLVFAEAGSRISITGGPYAYVETALGPFLGFLAGILLCLTDVAAAGAVSMILAGSIGRLAHLAPVWTKIIVVAIVTGIAALNIRGVKLGARIIEFFTVAKLLPIFFFIGVGLFFINGANFDFSNLPPVGSIATTSGTLIFAFAGIEAALVPSGEVSNPSRNVPRAAMYALGLVTVLYILVQIVALGVLGGDLVHDTVAPLSTAAGSFAGNVGKQILLIGATISMFGWVTGSILAGPRAYFALGRDGFLPKQLAAVHPKYHTPHVAIVIYAILTLTLALSGTFERLAVLSNIAALGCYFLCAIGVVALRRRDVRTDGEPFLMPGGLAVPVLACLAIAWVFVQTVTKAEIIALAVVVVIALLGTWGRNRSIAQRHPEGNAR